MNISLMAFKMHTKGIRATLNMHKSTAKLGVKLFSLIFLISLSNFLAADGVDRQQLARDAIINTLKGAVGSHDKMEAAENNIKGIDQMIKATEQSKEEKETEMANTNDPGEKAKLEKQIQELDNQLEKLNKEREDESKRKEEAEKNLDSFLSALNPNKKAEKATKSGGGSGRGSSDKSPMMMMPQQQQPQQKDDNQQQPQQQQPQNPNITQPQQLNTSNTSEKNNEVLNAEAMIQQMQAKNNDAINSTSNSSKAAADKLIDTIQTNTNNQLQLLNDMFSPNNNTSITDSPSNGSTPTNVDKKSTTTVAEKFGNKSEQGLFGQNTKYGVYSSAQSTNNKAAIQSDSSPRNRAISKMQKKIVSSLHDNKGVESAINTSGKESNAADILSKLLGKNTSINKSNFSTKNADIIHIKRKFMPSQPLLTFIRKNQKLIGGSSKNIRNKIQDKKNSNIAKNKAAYDPSLRPHNKALLKRNNTITTHTLSFD